MAVAAAWCDDVRVRCYGVAASDASRASDIAILYRERGDRRAMFRWFRRAAELGDDDAYIDLAKCYLGGTGVRKSVDEGIRCLARAMAGSATSEAELEEAGELLATLRPRAL